LGETGIGRVFESVPVRSCMIPIPRQQRTIKKRFVGVNEALRRNAAS
jgi:hypothetical protein